MSIMIVTRHNTNINRKRLSRKTCVWLFLFIFLFAVMPLVQAQTPPPDHPDEDNASSPHISATLLSWLSELRAQRKELDERLLSLNALEPLTTSMSAISLEIDQLENKVQELLVNNISNYSTIMNTRGTVRQISERNKQLIVSLDHYLVELNNLQKWWADEAAKLADFTTAHFAEQETTSVTTMLEECRELISQSRQSIRTSFPALLEFQSRASAHELRLEKLTTQLDNRLKTVRGELFRKNSPSFFSKTFLNELKSIVGRDGFIRNLHISLLDKVFIADHAWLLISQVLVVVLLVYFLRLHQGLPERQDWWQLLTRTPWSSALFLSLVLFIPLYGSLPESWRLFYWVLGSISSIRVMTGIFPEKWQQRLIITILTPFILSLIFKLIDLPQPLFRLYIAGIALFGAPISFRLAGKIGNQSRLRALLIRVLHCGGVILGLIFIAQITGFSFLAGHVFEASVKSLMLVLFSFMFIKFVERGLKMLLDSNLFKRWPVLQKNKGIILQRAMKLIRALIIILVLMMSFVIWGFFDSPLQAWHVVSLVGIQIGSHRITLQLFLLAIFALVLTWYTSKAIQTVLEEEVYPRKQIDPGVSISINRLVHYALILLGFFWFISILGFDLQNVTIIGGALGIGIGFGLQNIVSNFVSGLVLLVERPVKIGDVVVIDETWGEIQKMGLRSTVIRTFDQSEIIIPNSDLIMNKVVNWTHTNRMTRLKIQVGVSYDSDVDKVMQILLEIASAHPLSLTEPAPRVHFLALGESSLDFEVWVWLAELSQRITVKTELLTRIFNRFKQENITIPFPQRDIHIIEPPSPKPPQNNHP